MEKITLINWLTKNQDKDFTALWVALCNGWVYDGLALSYVSWTTYQVTAGNGLILCTKTDGSKVLLHYENTATFQFTNTGTFKVWVAVTQANLDNPALNIADGTGIWGIAYGADYPADNYIPLGTVAATVCTDARTFSLNYAVSKLNVDETILGIKTFWSFLITPSTNPTAAYEVANKQYVDTVVSAQQFFLGDWSDGALIVASGTTSLTAGAVYNYSSISISVWATLNTSGDWNIILKCQWTATISGTINMSWKAGSAVTGAGWRITNAVWTAWSWGNWGIWWAWWWTAWSAWAGWSGRGWWGWWWGTWSKIGGNGWAGWTPCGTWGTWWNNANGWAGWTSAGWWGAGFNASGTGGTGWWTTHGTNGGNGSWGTGGGWWWGAGWDVGKVWGWVYLIANTYTWSWTVNCNGANWQAGWNGWNGNGWAGTHGWWGWGGWGGWGWGGWSAIVLAVVSAFSWSITVAWWSGWNWGTKGTDTAGTASANGTAGTGGTSWNSTNSLLKSVFYV